jgi:salicylate hydroxylase
VPALLPLTVRFYDTLLTCLFCTSQHGSLQGTSLSLEDGAVLAKLFSHLCSEDQIPSFLYAFQDLRIPRCSAVSTSELGNMVFMTFPPGDHQAGRDMMLRAKDAAGLNDLTPDEDDESDINSERWEQVKYMFGYDAEDEADNWWVQWGLLAMRAKGFDLRADVNFPIDQVTI